MTQNRLVIIDVRTDDEIAQIAAPSTRHIPLDRLVEQLGQIDRSIPLAFLCRSGSRSSYATNIAIASGYQALNIVGGILAWQEAGQPVVSPARGDDANPH